MRNEEKAKRIAEKFIRWYQKDDESYGAYCGAIEAMEWKDKQLHEELLKLSLTSNPHDYLTWVTNKEKELSEQLKNK